MPEHSPNRVMFLQASLLGDTVRDAALRKNHRGKTTKSGEGAIDICKSGETTAQHLTIFAVASDPSEIHVFRHRDEKTGICVRKGARRIKKYKYCEGTHERKRGKWPTFG